MGQVSAKDNESAADGELSIGPGGVSAKNSAYEDLRPLVRGAVGVGAPLLEFVGAVVGIPAEYLARKLNAIRERYESNLAKIPEPDRQLPRIEITSSVIRNAAVASDDPELQALFAELLTSASDAKRAQHPHPAFGTIIAELEPLDAKVLSMFPSLERRTGLYPSDIQTELGFWHHDKVLRVAISNLCRLELIWKRQQSGFDAATFLGSLSGRDPTYGVIALVEAFEQLAKAAEEDFHSVYLTPLGERFVAACVPRGRSS